MFIEMFEPLPGLDLLDIVEYLDGELPWYGHFLDGESLLPEPKCSDITLFASIVYEYDRFFFENDRYFYEKERFFDLERVLIFLSFYSIKLSEKLIVFPFLESFCSF